MEPNIFHVIETNPAIDAARQAGVKRGINACIDELYLLRQRHNKRSSGYHDLTIAIDALSKLTISEVEG